MKDAKDLDHRPIFVRSYPKHHNMPTLATGASDVQREQTLQNIVAASDAWNVWPIWQGLDSFRESFSVVASLCLAELLFRPSNNDLIVRFRRRGEADDPRRLADCHPALLVDASSASALSRSEAR
jgi:hypothetical protein